MSKQLSDIERDVNALWVMKDYIESQMRGIDFSPRQVYAGISAEDLRKELAKYAEYEKPHPLGLGDALQYEFPNGYGISIIRHEYSYGASEGLWEAALLKDDTISYRDDIFDNSVEGYLSPEDIKERIEQIMALMPGHEPSTLR